MEILAMVAKGFSEDKIGRRLGISDRTVRRRKLEILRSYDVDTMMEAVVAAVREGLI